MKKHSAHTFAEVMISLIVVSIIAALLYPMLMQFTPNTNKPLFQAAYRTLTVIISEIVHANINGELATNAGNALTDAQLCEAFCNRANIVPENNVSACNNICNDQVLTTSNGMRWHFDGNNANGAAYRISVDVNASNNDLPSANNDGVTNDFDNNGVFTFADNGIVRNNVYNIDNLKAQDSFWIDIDNRGKVLDMSPAGWANLEDSAETLE